MLHTDAPPIPCFLSPIELAQLPLRARIADRLAALLILADEVLAEFQTEEANKLLWFEPHVRAVYTRVDRLMETVAQ